MSLYSTNVQLTPDIDWASAEMKQQSNVQPSTKLGQRNVTVPTTNIFAVGWLGFNSTFNVV